MAVRMNPPVRWLLPTSMYCRPVIPARLGGNLQDMTMTQIVL